MNEKQFLLWFVQYCALAANYKPHELVDDFLANVHLKYEAVRFSEKCTVEKLRAERDAALAAVEIANSRLREALAALARLEQKIDCILPAA